MEENNDLSGNSNVNKVNNKNALASFICSLVGLLVAGIPCGIAAVILGALGLKKFNPETEKNKWMAIFGIVLGVIDAIVVTVCLPFILQSIQ